MAVFPKTTSPPGGDSPEGGFVQNQIFKCGEWFFFVNALVMGCVLLTLLLGGFHLVFSDLVGGRTFCAVGIMVVLAGLAILNAEWEGDWQYPESEDDEDEDETEQVNEEEAKLDAFLEQLAGEFPWVQEEAQQPAPKSSSSHKRLRAANQAVVADLTGNNSHAAPAAAAGRDPLQDRLLRLRERLKMMEVDQGDGEPDEEPERDAEFDRLLQRIGTISNRLGMVDSDGVVRPPVGAEGASEPDAEPPSGQTVRLPHESDEALSTLRRRHATESSPGQKTC